MEAPRLVVGAAALSRAPLPGSPLPSVHRRLAPPCGAAQCRLLFAGAPRPALLLTRCSYSRKGKGNSRGKPRRSESSSTVRLEVEANSDQGTSLADEQRKGDIWEFFREAQRNILHLNKQRLVAMEELKKLQDENKSLLQEIEALEAEWQGTPPSTKTFSVGTIRAQPSANSMLDVDLILTLSIFHDLSGVSVEAAQSSSFCELLLRIDTMVIAGRISTAEASELRKKTIDNRSIIQNAFSDIHHKSNDELLSELQHFLREPIEKPLHVVHICSEMDPITSCGPLSTYVAGLSCTLQRKGNLVEVILPKYGSIDLHGIHGLRKAEAEYESYFGGRWHKNRIWTGTFTSSGVGFTLIEPVQRSYFNRDMLLGYPDDFERFSYFSRASLDYIVKSGKQPDILHIHNWETAIVAPLFWDIFAHQGLENTCVLLTCQDLNSQVNVQCNSCNHTSGYMYYRHHQMRHEIDAERSFIQFLEEPKKLELCGLDPHKLHRADRLQDLNKTNLVNILKGGIVYSNKVILMSSTHSKDVLIEGLRHGLEATLTTHQEKILVASHGLDGDFWDPSKDIYLPRGYYANNIEGKSFCRKALKRRLGLRSSSSIIVGCIYDGDSDIHDLKEVLHVALNASAQVIFMENFGSVVNSNVQALKEELKFMKQGDKITFVEVYNEALAHLIFAGSDIILCSSFHELSLHVAVKAMKYGSIPVQINFPDESSEPKLQNDSRTSEPSKGHNCHNTAMSQYLISTYGNMSLSQALDDFKNDPSRWELRIKDGMAKGLSWDSECYDLHWKAYSSVRKL